MIKKGDKVMTPLGESQVAYIGDDGSVVTTVGTFDWISVSELDSTDGNYVNCTAGWGPYGTGLGFLMQS